MIAVGLFLLVLFVLVWWVRRRMKKADPPGPLAGYDTGVRSVWRVPGGKFFGPRRGF